MITAISVALLGASAAGCRFTAPDPGKDDTPTSGRVLVLADADCRPVIDQELLVFSALYPKAEVQVRYMDEADLVKVGAAFRLDDSHDAFLHAGGRDLSGFEDGTENPTGDAAREAAIVDPKDPRLGGSSFVAVQRWVHNFSRLEAMTADERDLSVGRRRVDNEEIDDAPESAHVKRTAQESFTPAAFVVRRSMPWVEGNRGGLMFVSFATSFDAFEARLRRMLGTEDGIVDGLFKFTHPETGAYFWCPGVVDGRLDLSPLGL